MRVRPLRADLERYLAKRGLNRRYKKQLALFELDHRHPSLHTERLEPKRLRLYSFRVDRKYRAIFILAKRDEAEVVDINDHYR